MVSILSDYPSRYETSLYRRFTDTPRIIKNRGSGTPPKGGWSYTKQCKFWRVSSVLIQGDSHFLVFRGGLRGGPKSDFLTLSRDTAKPVKVVKMSHSGPHPDCEYVTDLVDLDEDLTKWSKILSTTSRSEREHVQECYGEIFSSNTSRRARSAITNLWIAIVAIIWCRMSPWVIRSDDPGRSVNELMSSTWSWSYTCVLLASLRITHHTTPWSVATRWVVSTMSVGALNPATAYRESQLRAPGSRRRGPHRT